MMAAAEMVFYLVNKKHAYTISWFLEDWGREISDRVRMVPYSRFMGAERMPRGSYIFSDIERITPWGLDQVQKRWDIMERSGKCPIMLNEPRKVLKRLPLLNRLHEAGINDFNAYPIEEARRLEPVRFPVFVREANDHSGPYEDALIPDQAALDRAIERYRASGRMTINPIVTEFLDTADSRGVYRKFAAFRIGDRIVPTHIYVNHDWFVKSTRSSLDHELVEEEWTYVNANPHERELMEVFEIAGIGFGRIDYALLDGRIQVFEINTNPVVMRTGDPVNPDRRRRKQKVASLLMDAFLALDQPHAGHATAVRQ